jgi:hypothetical protein
MSTIEGTRNWSLMKTLLAICTIPLACLHLALADDPSPVQESMIAQCTEEGAAKGYKGKELEDFVAACVKARQSGSGDDPVIRAAISAC